MKKLLSGIILGVSLTAFAAFKVATYEANKSTAEVETVQGIYVFMTSKPVKEYEYLGTVKSGAVVASKDYDKLMPKMVEKAKEKFPNADAVLFKNNLVYECDAIKFK